MDEDSEDKSKSGYYLSEETVHCHKAS